MESQAPQEVKNGIAGLVMQQEQQLAFGYSRLFDLAMLALLVLVGLLAVVGNALLVYAILASRRTRHCPVMWLLLNLCACDLAISVLVVPATGHAFAEFRWGLGATACSLSHFLNVALMFASVFTLTALSVRRYRGVAGLLWRQQLVGQRAAGVTRRCAGLLLGLWGLSCLSATPVAINYTLASCLDGLPENATLSPELTDCRICAENWNRTLEMLGIRPSRNLELTARVAYSAFAVAALLVVPLCTICAAYFRIYRLLHRSARRLMRCGPDGAATNPSIRRRPEQRLERVSSAAGAETQAKSQRVFRQSMVMVLMFGLSWSPIHLCNMTLDICVLLSGPDSFGPQASVAIKDAYQVFVWLAMCNSAANPAFLLALDSTYRACLRGLFARLKSRLC